MATNQADFLFLFFFFFFFFFFSSSSSSSSSSFSPPLLLPLLRLLLLLFFFFLFLFFFFFFYDLQTNADLRLLNELLPVSSVFFDLSFQCFILHLSTHVCTQCHRLFFLGGGPLNRLPWGLLKNTWLAFLVQSILLKWPVQFNRLILTNESITM